MMHKFNSKIYSKIKRLSIVIDWSILSFTLIEKLWSVTVKNRFCTEHKSWTNIYGQLECQRKCELMKVCTGISYSHKDESTHYCYACKDTRLTIATNDFSFYERPGRPGLKIMYIRMNRSIKVIFIISIALVGWYFCFSFIYKGG